MNIRFIAITLAFAASTLGAQATSIRHGLCGDQDPATPGVAYGHVMPTHKSEGLPGIRVTLSWYVVGTSRDELGFLIPQSAAAITDDRGRYVFCGLPADFEGSLQAMSASDTTGAVTVALVWADSSIDNRVLLLPDEPRATSVVTGRIIDEDGNAISGASVDIPGRTSSVKSRSDGSFSLVAPAGTQTVRVRKLGLPARIEAEDIAEPATQIEIKMGKPLPRLATVIVRGMMSEVSDRSGFGRRAASGPGQYVTAEQLEKSKARCVVDGMRYALINLTKGPGCTLNPVSNLHFRGMASLQGLQPNQADPHEAAKMPVASAAASGCMRVLVDDFAEPLTGGVIDLSWLDPAEVVGIEYYSAASSPGRLGQSRCNTILIWTLYYRGPHY
jgi:hypothetical protein